MTVDLALEIAAKSLASSGIALLLLRLTARRSASERSWIAHAGLLTTLLLPIAASVAPAWRVAPAPTGRAADTEVATVFAPLGEGVRGSVLARRGVAPGGDTVAAIDPDAVLLGLYALPVAVLLAVTLIAVMRLFALRRRAAVLVEQAWLSAMAHAQRRMGFKHGTALLVSGEIRSPVSWGLLRPVIVLNEEALAARGEAEAIIAHELAHVARLDWAKLLLARLTTALLWFNPLVWLLARACHQLREEAADDAVLNGAVDRAAYAALLVGAARHEQSGLLLAANGVAPVRSSLGRRVRRVLDGTQRRTPARGGWVAACSLGAIAVAAPLAALTTVRGLPAGAPGSPAELAAEASPARAPTIRPTLASARLTIAAGLPAGRPAPPAPAAPAIAAAPPAEPSPLAPAAIVQMAERGTDGRAMRGVAAVGAAPGRLTWRELVALRALGVSEVWLGEMAALGYRDVDYRQIVALTVHGVTPGFVRAMAAAGYPGLSVEQLTAFRIYGVSPDFARRFGRKRHPGTDAAKLVRMKIYGVAADDDPHEWVERADEADPDRADD